MNLDLSSKSHRAVRDLFIIGCITGIRFSDYNKLIKNNVQKIGKHQVLRFRVMKTFQHITIPLHSKVIEILESWDYNIPLYSNGYSNMLLKEIGKLAEIDEEVFLLKIRAIVKLKIDIKNTSLFVHIQHEDHLLQTYI